MGNSIPGIGLLVIGVINMIVLFVVLYEKNNRKFYSLFWAIWLLHLFEVVISLVCMFFLVCVLARKLYRGLGPMIAPGRYVKKRHVMF